MSKTLNLRQEILRKSIHLLTISLPIFYIILGRPISLIVFLILALFVVFIDIFSKEGKFLHSIVYYLLGDLIRDHEKDNRWWKLNGASWVTISAFFSFLIFPEKLAITGFVILVLADPAAAILGKKFGKENNLGKSFVGSVAFFTMAIVVVMLINYLFKYGTNFMYIGLVSTFFATIAEAYSKKLLLDDNISVPFSFSISYLIIESIFL